MTKTKLTFEKRLERIKDITALLKTGDLPLEEGLKLYQEGVRLSQECSQELDQARIIMETAGQENTGEEA